MHKTFRFFKWSGKKAILLFVLTVLLASLVLNATIAYLLTRTQTIRNKFPPAELEISSWSGNDIINSGDVPIYVRASIRPTWTSDNAEKTVHAVAPIDGEDFTVTVASNWLKASDGFYYYKNPVGVAQSVTLVTEAAQLKQMEGHTLRVFVISSAIQTTPADAIENSWRAVEVASDGTLQLKE